MEHRQDVRAEHEVELKKKKKNELRDRLADECAAMLAIADVSGHGDAAPALLDEPPGLGVCLQRRIATPTTPEARNGRKTGVDI